jgi:hypothetical protein
VLRLEAVAHSVHGKEMRRDAGLGLKLLAKSDDMRIHRTRVRVIFVAPNRIEDQIARQHALRVLQKEQQQVVFGGRDLYFFASAGHVAALYIDFDVAELRHAPGMIAAAAQHRADAGEQLARAEGLHQVIVGADLEQQDFIHLVSDRAQDNDGGRNAVRAQLLADLDAAHAGKAQVD